jgi:hypothetical protein
MSNYVRILASHIPKLNYDVMPRRTDRPVSSCLHKPGGKKDP